ncbi:T6SS immunity protein Tdi1 domain-containing protein [Pelagibius marinus]|uniref:T6SS immunity protein Tdi1 domain-containing protein n=1 Tax=Pelagibius marinus TaxID=2762760 RepID=UPI0018725CF5|nr:T6SS immunity protein Tdi1 domain-containing protein [Pelagibius marinus]
MTLVNIISEAWGWTGIRPRRIVDRNAFGNLLIEDHEEKYWRICPEELSCSVVAGGTVEFQQLIEDAEFRRDWQMAALVAEAEAELGEPEEGRCFCLKIPAVVGGAYTMANIGQICLEELIGFSGDFAEQIKDLPDGARIRLKVVE